MTLVVRGALEDGGTLRGNITLPKGGGHTHAVEAYVWEDLYPYETCWPGEIWWSTPVLKMVKNKDLRDGWLESWQLLAEEEPFEVALEEPLDLLNKGLLIKKYPHL